MTETEHVRGCDPRRLRFREPGVARISIRNRLGDETIDIPDLTPDVLPTAVNMMPEGLRRWRMWARVRRPERCCRAMIIGALLRRWQDL